MPDAYCRLIHVANPNNHKYAGYLRMHSGMVAQNMPETAEAPWRCTYHTVHAWDRKYTAVIVRAVSPPSPQAVRYHVGRPPIPRGSRYMGMLEDVMCNTREYTYLFLHPKTKEGAE